MYWMCAYTYIYKLHILYIYIYIHACMHACNVIFESVWKQGIPVINRKAQAQVASYFSTHLQRNPQPYTAWCRLKDPWPIVATPACHIGTSYGSVKGMPEAWTQLHSITPSMQVLATIQGPAFCAYFLEVLCKGAWDMLAPAVFNGWFFQSNASRKNARSTGALYFFSTTPIYLFHTCFQSSSSIAQGRDPSRKHTSSLYRIGQVAVFDLVHLANHGTPLLDTNPFRSLDL